MSHLKRMMDDVRMMFAEVIFTAVLTLAVISLVNLPSIC